ncbi:MAG: glutamine-hydrolyzing GMP synthase [Turicibacter sp.]|nr:glutamine-hydrolyzing GMP synthase [Turicibacter sp.]
MSQIVLVLDFGGQYKELIARTIRSLGVYTEIKRGDMPISDILETRPIGIVLTGGPKSVYAADAPKCSPELFDLGIPILGICYGMQLMCHLLGGVVDSSVGEYGKIKVSDKQGDFYALMSHSDAVMKLPMDFEETARTATCIAACANIAKRLYAVQYHPESVHTENGVDIFKDFLKICGAVGDYKLEDYLAQKIAETQKLVGEEEVLLALSGGVDSSVCAALLSRAIPERLTCIFVDHGLMRQDEGDEIEGVFQNRLKFIRINAKNRFFAKLKRITEPEQKRKIIGTEFARIFEEEAAKLGHIKFLAQGTIYPDIVESGVGVGATIKSHHNVGGLPKNLQFTGLVEPLSGLFKDEVRQLGLQLDLPDFLVNRQPFPGPGLAIRIIGEVTEAKVEILQRADAILREEIEKSLTERPDQYFAVMTDTLSVGVKGDERTYDSVIAIRAVKTTDFMTCEYFPLPHDVLKVISQRITNELSEVSRIVYDISSKPPATIEWE